MSDPVTVQVYPYRSDAEIASARLAADGIRSAIRADDEGGLNPGFFRHYGIRLEVDAVDLDDAYESLGIGRITVSRSVIDTMFAHAAWSYPNEACGLLAMDDDDVVHRVFCLTNVDASPSRFTIDPAEYFGCIRHAEHNGWRVGGVFHSHTTSEAYPSRSDVAGGGDPDWVHFVVGPIARSRPVARVFQFDGDHVSEVSLTVEP